MLVVSWPESGMFAKELGEIPGWGSQDHGGVGVAIQHFVSEFTLVKVDVGQFDHVRPVKNSRLPVRSHPKSYLKDTKKVMNHDEPIIILYYIQLER